MNPRRIIAIAQLTVRDAIRSRLLLALAALILTVLIAIPLLIADTSSPADRLSVILLYSLNAVLFILTVSTLWASCVAVAGDIADRRLHLVLAKPVHRYELWLGKWIGIVLLNLAVLAVSGSVMAGILFRSWNSLPAGSPQRLQAEARLLTARTPFLPELPPNLEQQVEKRLAALPENPAIPAQASRQQQRQWLRREVIHAAMMIPSGGSLSLHYRIPSVACLPLPCELRFSMESSQPDRQYVSGIWQIADATGQHLSIPFTNAPGIPSQILIPAFSHSTHGPLTITLTRTDTGNSARLLLAPNGNPPELLIPVGAFGPNFCRALLIAWFRLAFVAALGITMGCLLSLPVSVFAAFAVLVLLHLSGFISMVAATGTLVEHHHGDITPPGLLDLALLRFITAINHVTGPLDYYNAIPWMAEGRRITWEMTAKAFGVLSLLYSAAVAIPGILLFNRREMP
jgi:hypothetical protein